MDMEFKGTKGDWSYRKDRNENKTSVGYHILNNQEFGWGQWLASVSSADLAESNPKEVEANAKLIAAAPELLEALQSLQFRVAQALELGLITVNKTETETDMRIAEKAINKALK